MSSHSRRQTIAVVLFLVVAAVFGITFRPAVVHGVSMQPTYRGGEYVLVNRLFRLTGSLTKGDVVLVRRGNDVLIKRIAYMPGEVIFGQQAIPFVRVAEYFERPSSPAETGGKPDRWALKVPQGYVVILGDNSLASDDSRIFGPVPTGDIIGRVLNAPPKS